MNILLKIKKKYKYGLLIQYFLDRLSGIGLGFHPFYLVEEGKQIKNIDIEPQITPIEARFLIPNEIKILSQHPEVGYNYQELLARLDHKCKCFGLLHHNQIIAYMWCNFSKCESWLSYTLGPNEAYLFDALSFKAYRGKGLAPFLRKKLYQYLRDTNINKFYSVTDRFNTPAINFKKKIGAINLKLYIHIRIFKCSKVYVLKKV